MGSIIGLLGFYSKGFFRVLQGFCGFYNQGFCGGSIGGLGPGGSIVKVFRILYGFWVFYSKGFGGSIRVLGVL